MSLCDALKPNGLGNGSSVVPTRDPASSDASVVSLTGASSRSVFRHTEVNSELMSRKPQEPEISAGGSDSSLAKKLKELFETESPRGS